MKRNWRRALLGVASMVVACLGLTGTASAGVVVQTTTNCSNQVLETPFARWNDNGLYTLVPGGSFEGGATGWALGGNAQVVSGNETYAVGHAGDSRSLRLPAGSTAVSAPICVGLQHPTLRFFAKRNSGLLSTLVVAARVHLQLGGTLDVPVGVIASGGSWTPTPTILYLANVLPLLPGQYTSVQFTFTPLLGDWSVDDVYVDPMRTR